MPRERTLPSRDTPQTDVREPRSGGGALRVGDGLPMSTSEARRRARGVERAPVGRATGNGDPGPGTRVYLELGGGGVVTDFGDMTFDCDPPTTPTLGPSEVRVTVCVKLDQTPVVNREALKNFGFTFPGDYFRVSSVARME